MVPLSDLFSVFKRSRYCLRHEARCVFLLLFLSVFSACRNDTDQNTPHLYSRILKSGNGQFDPGRFDGKGKRFLDSAYAAAGEVNIADKFQHLIYSCGYSYHTLRDYDKALLYADSMISLILKNGKQKSLAKEYAQALYSKGDILSQKKLYDEAFEHYFKARNIAQNLIDSCTLGDYSYRLGMLMYKKRQFDQAGRFFKQGFEETKSCANDFWSFYRRQELLNNTALSFLRAGKTDSALIYSEKTLHYIKENEHKFAAAASQAFEVAKAVVYNGMGSALLQKGEYGEAEQLFTNSIAINSAKGGDTHNAQTARLELARLYFETHKYTHFRKVLSDLKVSLLSTSDITLEAEWHNLLWQYYQAQNEPDDAFLHLLQYSRLKDSVDGESRALLNSNLIDKLKYLENENEIESLRRDADLNEIYLAVMLLVAVMAVVIIWQTVQNWKKSRGNLKVLEAFNRQVNDQKRQLEVALSELEKRNNEKDRILRSVAHDLRNPIGAITTLSLLMLRDEKRPAEDREMLALIQSTCSNSLDLINEILEASGAASTPDFRKEVADINLVLRNSVDLLNFKALEKDQRIVFQTCREPVLVYINREKISRVINNLLSNAIKFSPQGSVIDVSLAASGGKVLMSVTDQGIGIPDNMRNKIFNMFTPAKRSGTAGEKSFGLGLSISRSIVEAHGGKIWFESIPEKGTSFYIELDHISRADLPVKTAESDTVAE
ncbi:MAG TPA: tetratricopeptide repeat-containing sensor histidine kinase [Sphingobacteriaceae bacterium]